MPCLCRELEGANVPDVGDREPVGRKSASTILIVLIVHEEEFLVFSVKEPSLMSVLGAFVGSAGDDAGISLVGYVVDGETVLVVCVTDIVAKEFRVRALVLKALGIVNITILGSTPRAGRLCGIRQINEDQAACTSAVPRLCTNTNRIAEILINDNVVRATVFQNELDMLFTRERKFAL